MYSHPFAPIQILTGDTREGCNARCGRLLDDGRSFPPKSRIERRFESSPGVQRVATLGVFLRYFLHAAKSTNPFPFREVRGSANLEAAHPNNKFARTKLNPFGTSRGFPNLDSARRNGGFAQTKLNPSPLCGDHCPTFCKAQK